MFTLTTDRLLSAKNKPKDCCPVEFHCLKDTRRTIPYGRRSNNHWKENLTPLEHFLSSERSYNGQSSQGLTEMREYWRSAKRVQPNIILDPSHQLQSQGLRMHIKSITASILERLPDSSSWPKYKQKKLQQKRNRRTAWRNTQQA